MVNSFPLEGVIGIVANGSAEIDFALDHGLSCIEIRADLLIKGGTSEEDEELGLDKAEIGVEAYPDFK